MEDCTRVGQLWDREIAGEDLSSEEIDLIESHLEACDSCRFEAAAFDSMSADGDDGPVPFTGDDIARRKWIDDTISKVRARRDEAIDEEKGGAGRWKALAAAAVIALIGGAAAFFAISPHHKAVEKISISSETPAAVATPPAPVKGGVLLYSGRVVSEHGELSEDIEIGTGSVLEVKEGRAIVDLGTGIKILLDSGASVRVPEMSADGIRLSVQSGKIIAMVDPHRAGPPFSVATESGRVLVTGTVFSVEVTRDEGARVGVMRGSVRLEEKGMPPRSITVGEAAVMGTAGVSPISEDEKVAAASAIDVLDVLTAQGHAEIRLDSLPGGAKVSLDSAPLGTTPLFARVRPGHRVAQLSMEGRTSVREFLEIGRGSEISRVFDLEADAGPDPAQRAATAVAKLRKGSGPSPSDLLARAQRLRAVRDWRGAAKAYDALIDQFPSTVEGRMSLVSLGAIRLDHLGDSKGALRCYDRYLAAAGKGTLAQEAAYGRIRALRKMGDTARERAALERFLSRFPDALLADAARARLEEI